MERYSLENRIRRRNNPKNQEKKNRIISYIQNNPLAGTKEVDKNCHIRMYDLFNMKELYEYAGIKYYNGHEKRTLKIRYRIIEFIKKNPNTNQWEINDKCKTHVQSEFKGGIKEAFRIANVEYPNRTVFGVVDKKIKTNALNFEDYVIKILNIYGDVVKHPKNNNNGIPDALFKTESGTYLVEIKNYTSKPISKSEIMQLNKYLDDSKYKNGILITSKKDQKEKVYIGNNCISIVTADELLRGCSLTW